MILGIGEAKSPPDCEPDGHPLFLLEDDCMLAFIDFSGRDGNQVESFGITSFLYYFQREDLRYQSITTEPTMAHWIDWNSNWKPNKKTNVNFGLKFNYDKNGDLDSLDVNHMSLQPILAINYIPNPKWMVSLGYSLQHYKSSGPITVALFDG